MLRLITLGRIDLTDAQGRSVEAVLKRPKRLALLTYLALGGEGSARSRDSVLGLFWPDQTQARARQSLNQALYVLRQELGSELIVSVGNDRIGLAPGRLWCDAVALRAAERSGDHRSVQAHYRGDFLPGFFPSDTPEFERWLDGERATLRRLASSSAWKLAVQAAAAGDAETAAEAAVRSADLASREEGAVRRAIELLDGLGDRARALALYRELVAELAEELETTPSPETQRLVAQVRARQPSDEIARAAAGSGAGGEDRQVGGGGNGEDGGHGGHGPAGDGEVGAGTPVPDDAAATVAGSARPVSSDAEPAAADPGTPSAALPWARRWRLAGLAALGAAAAIAALTYAWLRAPEPASAGTAPAPQVAVEPFEARTGDDRLTDVAGAITTGLAARLAQVAAIEVVVAAPAATSPSDTAAEISAAAAQAGTRPSFLVRGRVLRDGERMRAIVSLIDRPSGQVIGSATIERVTSDAIDFIDDATGDAAVFVRAAMGRELRERAWRASTANHRAWQLLERGEADRREAKSLRERRAADAARVALHKADSLLALAEDAAPGWVAPIVVRARVARDAMWGSLVPPSVDHSRALELVTEGIGHADRALAHDSSDARARELKGVLLHWQALLQPMSGDSAAMVMRQSLAELRAAVEADPMRAEAWSMLSAMLYHLGRFEEGYYAAQEAYDADAFLDQPQDILVKLFTGAFESDDDDAAREWCASLRERYPGSPAAAHCALTLMSWVEPIATLDIEGAWQLMASAQLPPNHPLRPQLELMVAHSLVRAGDEDSALAVLRRIDDRGSRSWETRPLEAALMLALGQSDSASALLRDYVAQIPWMEPGITASRRLRALPSASARHPSQ